jgi:hypothetical protein
MIQQNPQKCTDNIENKIHHLAGTPGDKTLVELIAKAVQRTRHQGHPECISPCGGDQRMVNEIAQYQIKKKMK